MGCLIPSWKGSWIESSDVGGRASALTASSILWMLWGIDPFCSSLLLMLLADFQKLFQGCFAFTTTLNSIQFWINVAAPLQPWANDQKQWHFNYYLIHVPSPSQGVEIRILYKLLFSYGPLCSDIIFFFSSLEEILVRILFCPTRTKQGWSPIGWNRCLKQTLERGLCTRCSLQQKSKACLGLPLWS